MPTLSISDIVAQAIQTGQTIQDGATKSLAAATQGEELAKRKAQILDSVSQDMSLIESSAQVAQAKVQLEKQKIAVAQQVDYGNSANQLVRLGEAQTAANNKLLSNLEAVQKKRSVSFMENPIDWVVAQATLPSAEEDLANDVQTSKIVAGAIQDKNMALQSSYASTEKLGVVKSQAEMDAAVRVNAANAQLQALTSQQEALKYNLAGVDAVTQASTAQLNVMFQANNAVKAEEQLKMQKASHALDIKRFNAQQEEMALRKQGMKDSEDFVAVAGENINRARTASGHKALAGAELRFAVDRMMKNDPEQAWFYKRGQQIAEGGNVPIYGANAAETLAAAENSLVNVGALDKLKQETFALIKSAEASLPPTVSKKDAEAYATAINGKVADEVANQYAQIVPRSGNIFDVGDIKNFIGNKAVANLPFTQKVLAPLANNGQPLDDPKLVVALAKEAVSSGKVTMEEATKGIATIYRSASLYNQAARGFNSAGIVPPKAGLNYNVKLAMFGAATDLTNEANLKRHLMKSMFDEYHQPYAP